jgi:hypothetical protein
MPQPFYEREQYSHTGCKRRRFGRRVSEGLAHNAYIVGTAGKAAIINARVNGDINLETAARNIFTTTHSFETYRVPCAGAPVQGGDFPRGCNGF